MTPEAQNIAIAEACGWTFHHNRYFPPAGSISRPVPNYVGDLNAMHKAEAILIVKAKRGQDYVNNLDEICGDAYGEYHATAEQRAEALLRTIGKWVD